MRNGRIASVILALGTVAGGIIVLDGLVPSLLPDVTQRPGLQKNPRAEAQPNFSAITDVRQKKQAFFDFLRPLVEAENAKIQQQRDKLLQARARLERDGELSPMAIQALSDFATDYDFELRAVDLVTLDRLLTRVDVVPAAMVLVQAANESGWGSSRFAREGLNYFGQWCFSKGCGLVPNQRTPGLNHEVAKFDSVADSVSAYLNNLNTNPAYRELRDLRRQLREVGLPVHAEDLVPGLLHYSERKGAYVDELMQMLIHNQEYL